MKIYIETEMTELPKNCNECPYFVTTHIKTGRKDWYYETYCPFGNDYYKFEGHINARGDYDEIDTCPLRIETEEVL